MKKRSEDPGVYWYTRERREWGGGGGSVLKHL